jgi:hypothetical protein
VTEGEALRDWWFHLVLDHWWGFIPFMATFVGMIMVSIAIFAPIIIGFFILYVGAWKWALGKLGRK